MQHERVAEGQDRVLTLPRTWTPSRRRREIIQGIGEAQQPLRAMRTKARDGFITALRDAHRWASKKKGLWMGGLPSLGYDVKDRKLVVNETEADTVRMIFRRYLELGSVRALKAALEEEGVVSKLRRAADGSPYGGNSFSRGALCLMLQNRIYRGEIVHNGAANPGEHAAIVDEELWSQLYDDAGYSGGTMERPALKRLLADIAAHRIDAVVVYKVDRLTRSLADFAVR